MGGSRLTTVNENGRRKTHRPSNETVAAIDGYATHHSVSRIWGAAEPTSDRRFLGQTGDFCIRNLTLYNRQLLLPSTNSAESESFKAIPIRP